jgi:hypothetical protein
MTPAMKFNLSMLFVTNALLLFILAYTSFTSGLNLGLLYVVIGSHVGLWLVSNDPFDMVTPESPARSSIINYVIFMAVWAPLIVVVSHQNLFRALHLQLQTGGLDDDNNT